MGFSATSKVLKGIAVATIIVLSIPTIAVAQQAAANSLEHQLADAAAEGDTAKLVLLLNKGARIEAEDDEGRTALMYAARSGKAASVKLLLDKGANIDARNDKDGCTALNEAVFGGDTKTVRLLLDHGANIESMCSGFTPLLDAAYGGKTEIAAMLVEKSAVIEAKVSDGMHRGWTALMLAVFQGHVDTAKVLLDKGADPFVVMASGPWRGATLLDLATNPGLGAKPDAGLIELLRSIRPTARQEFEQYIAELQKNPSDDALREKIIKLALTLEPMPMVPQDAEAANGKAKTIFAHASTPDDLKAATAEFARASQLAPWVAGFYFNAGEAYEQASQLDEAVKALKFYLMAAPNAPDAGEVRGRIEGLRFEKDKSARKAVQAAQNEAYKYVAGGAKRVACATLFDNSFSDGITELYIYAGDSRCALIGEGYLSNVFQMPNGDVMAVVLQAQSRSDEFCGDQIYLAVLSSKPVGKSYSFGSVNGALRTPSGNVYKVSVSTLSADGVVAVSEEQSNASITLPLRDLYVARTQYLGRGTQGTNVFEGQDYLWRYQGGDPQSILFFDAHVTSADPFNRTPRYVVLNNGRDRQVANSGYHVHWNGNRQWTIER